MRFSLFFLIHYISFCSSDQSNCESSKTRGQTSTRSCPAGSSGGRFACGGYWCWPCRTAIRWERVHPVPWYEHIGLCFCCACCSTFFVAIRFIYIYKIESLSSLLFFFFKGFPTNPLEIKRFWEVSLLLGRAPCARLQTPPHHRHFSLGTRVSISQGTEPRLFFFFINIIVSGFLFPYSVYLSKYWFVHLFVSIDCFMALLLQVDVIAGSTRRSRCKRGCHGISRRCQYE